MSEVLLIFGLINDGSEDTTDVHKSSKHLTEET